MVPIHLPPLTDRREDIPALVDHFVACFATERRIRTPAIATEAIAALQAYDWPGNVRQLRNIVERTIILAPGDRSTEYHFHYYEEECVYVLSGRGTAVIGDQTHKLGPGDFLGHPIDKVAHEMINDSSEPLVCLVIGQRLAQDITDYPRQGKRLYRHSGERSLVDIGEIKLV